DDDRQAVIHAEGNRGRIHDLEPLLEDLQIRNRLVLGGVAVDHRVGGVDAVDLGALEDDVRLHFHGPEGGGGVGGEVGIAGAGGEHYDPALLEVTDRTAANERFGNRSHLDRGGHAGGHPDVLERVLQRQRVDDGRQHA